MVEEKKEHQKKGGWGALILGFIISFLVGWIFFGNHFAVPPLYGKLTQPVSFSHNIHVKEAEMACEDCHYLKPNGRWSGVPKLAKCVECHEEPQGETKEEAHFIKKFVETGREIPWLIYSKEPKNVFFSHAAHLKIAGFKCRRCHGEMGYNDKPPVYVYSKLSKYPQHTVIVMEKCMRCHKKFEAPNYCFTCHK